MKDAQVHELPGKALMKAWEIGNTRCSRKNIEAKLSEYYKL